MFCNVYLVFGILFYVQKLYECNQPILQNSTLFEDHIGPGAITHFTLKTTGISGSPYDRCITCRAEVPDEEESKQ